MLTIQRWPYNRSTSSLVRFNWTWLNWRILIFSFYMNRSLNCIASTLLAWAIQIWYYVASLKSKPTGSNFRHHSQQIAQCKLHCKLSRLHHRTGADCTFCCALHTEAATKFCKLIKHETISNINIIITTPYFESHNQVCCGDSNKNWLLFLINWSNRKTLNLTL